MAAALPLTRLVPRAPQAAVGDFLAIVEGIELPAEPETEAAAFLMPMPVPMPALPFAPSLRPLAADLQPGLQQLPTAPEGTSVELLTGPTTPPAGECAFELEMTAPAEPLAPATTESPVIELPRREQLARPETPSLSRRPAPLPPSGTPQKKRTPADLPSLPSVLSQAPAPPQFSGTVDVEPVAPVEAATEAAAIDDAPRQTAPTHQLALRVKTADDQSVDVRLVSRAGDVHVSVHTPDETLARAMRTELGSLTGKLAQAGFGIQSISTERSEGSTLSERRESSPESGNPEHHSSHDHREQPQHQHGRGRRPAWFFSDEELN
jgi:flagellar hook-length control protein FliK